MRDELAPKATHANRALPWRGRLPGSDRASPAFRPKAGKRAFGKDPGEEDDHTFHRATSIRQAYIGALIILLALVREQRALGALLVTASVVPAADFLLALKAPDGGFGKALRHAPSVPLVVALGLHFLRR